MFWSASLSSFLNHPSAIRLVWAIRCCGGPNCLRLLQQTAILTVLGWDWGKKSLPTATPKNRRGRAEIIKISARRRSISDPLWVQPGFHFLPKLPKLSGPERTGFHRNPPPRLRPKLVGGDNKSPQPHPVSPDISHSRGNSGATDESSCLVLSLLATRGWAKASSRVELRLSWSSPRSLSAKVIFIRRPSMPDSTRQCKTS